MSDDDFTLDGASALVAGTAADRDKRAPRFSWTGPYEATFFRSLCESVQLGLRENHSFKSEAWDRAAAALQQQHQAYPTKSHLVNKSDNARKKFRLWRGLREDPEFLYNPATRTVTATEEAWKNHIMKEPLSRTHRGRAFEHEEYMEILYPDVIGSGGAPKRIMKTKRKGPDALQSDDPEMPGTGVMDLNADSPYRPPSQPGLPQQQQQQLLNQPFPPPAPMQQRQMSLPQQRPTSTAIPPRTHITGTSALTPPEETATHGRRRFPAPHGVQPNPNTNEVTMAPAANMGPPAPQGPTHAEKRRRVSSLSQNNAVATNSSAASAPAAASASTPSDSATASLVSAGKQLIEENILRIADALKGPAPRSWPEQAIDIFFRDFAKEDMDLQLKIAEKALTDENKAMVFCKMPAPLRSHWVKRLREVHNNRVT